MIIINADDFGISESVNTAILSSFQRGYISSTSIMPTMPGFQSAVEIAHEYKLNQKIGLHFNLTEGEPLTDPIKRLSKFCSSEGLFCFKRFTHFWLSSQERTALEIEISAQIDLCQTSGLPVTHIDSHHHVHTELPILKSIMRVARTKGVSSIRKSRNLGSISQVSMLYKKWINCLMRRKGFWTTDYFSNLDELANNPEALKQQGKSFEIMVHPGLNSNGEVFDCHEKTDFGKKVKDLLSDTSLSPYPQFAS